MEEHKVRVSNIASRIKELRKTSIPFRIYHGSTNSTRPTSRTHSNTVDISGMNHVVSIDSIAKTCLVEPNVPMDALVAAALKHDLVPPVIPEFPGITVGGAFAGTAGESSSFRHGFFEDCVNWAEIVLANGEVVIASESQNTKLFHGSKGTFGTLGVGTLFEVRLVPAKKFVQLSYCVVTRGISEAKELMREECLKGEEDVQFVDGIMFSRDNGVVVLGKMTSHPLDYQTDGKKGNLAVITFSKPWDQWFYLHAQDIMNMHLKKMMDVKNIVPHRELVPLADYLFRYDRGGFWTARYGFKYFVTPFNRFTRRILDRFMHTRTMYHALHRSGMIQKFIIQDMAVPWRNIEPWFDWLDENLGIYPLWLAPLKLGNGGMHFNPSFAQQNAPSAESEDFVLNVGLWGFCPKDTLKINRDIEAKLKELRGMKWLYSQTFYTEDEFWSVYDREWYESLRTKYDAKTLPDVYDKVGGTALNQRNVLTGVWKIWPLAGVYGVLSTLKGGDYLRKR